MLNSLYTVTSLLGRCSRKASTKQKTLLLSAAVVGCAYTYYCSKLVEAKTDHDRVHSLVNMYEEIDEMAEDCIDDDADLARAPQVQQQEGWGEAQPIQPVPLDAHGLWEVDRSRVVIRDYRKISPHLMPVYITQVLCSVRNQLGVPQKTEANVKVVRRIANQVMTGHRLRECHKAKVLPVVEHLAFIQTDLQLKTIREVRHFHLWKTRFLRWLWDACA